MEFLLEDQMEAHERKRGQISWANRGEQEEQVGCELKFDSRGFAGQSLHRVFSLLGDEEVSGEDPPKTMMYK